MQTHNSTNMMLMSTTKESISGTLRTSICSWVSHSILKHIHSIILWARYAILIIVCLKFSTRELCNFSTSSIPFSPSSLILSTISPSTTLHGFCVSLFVISSRSISDIVQRASRRRPGGTVVLVAVHYSQCLTWG